MTEITIFDELILFTKELIELLNEDWIKIKKFIKENIKYVFWVCVLFITMQFTDIISLGASYDRYCKLNGIQRGGEGHPPEVKASPPAGAPTGTPAAPHGAPPGGEHGAAPHGAPPGGEHGAAPHGAPGGEHGTDVKADAKKEKKEKKEKKPKSAVKGKGMTGKIKSSIQNNPVFGNLDKIFGMVEGMVALITLILIVVGIMSLPILMFIALTYCVLKIMFTQIIIL
jgi:hypothetical protein